MKDPQVRFQRKTVIGLILIVIASGFLLSQIAPVHSAPQATKRLFENKIPVHVPLGIKLKEGKEAKVQNLSNKNWFRDLEIEITNNSEKPIYFLSLYVTMPDVKNYAGAVMMFPVWFGRGEFTNFDTKPMPDDVPLQPKETYTYTVSEKRSIAWERWLAINQKDDATRLELIFGQLSFGDGTGFVTTGAIPFPFQTNPGELAYSSWLM